MPDELTKTQEAKIKTVPLRYKAMYREAVLGSRRAAIRYHCLECVAWLPSEVEACSAGGCVLFPYRLTGTHPDTAAANRQKSIASWCGKGLRPGLATDEETQEPEDDHQDGPPYTEPTPEDSRGTRTT